MKRPDQNMVTLKKKLHATVKHALDQSLDAEWKDIDFEKVIPLSTDGKASTLQTAPTAVQVLLHGFNASY